MSKTVWKFLIGESTVASCSLHLSIFIHVSIRQTDMVEMRGDPRRVFPVKIMKASLSLAIVREREKKEDYLPIRI